MLNVLLSDAKPVKLCLVIAATIGLQKLCGSGASMAYKIFTEKGASRAYKIIAMAPLQAYKIFTKNGASRAYKIIAMAPQQAYKISTENGASRAYKIIAMALLQAYKIFVKRHIIGLQNLCDIGSLPKRSTEHAIFAR